MAYRIEANYLRMQRGFWGALKKPIWALAPMADVTDAAFRRIITKYGKPDIMWTEFVSCDGLCSPGREILLRDLWYTEGEHPIVAQFFGANPDNFYACARLARELGFDGIDINMGCPERNVVKQGAGAAHIQNPVLAKEIVQATQSGAGDLPVSVKTRIGFNAIALEEWLGHLFEMDLAAITLHARTKKEMSLVPAHWDVVARAVAMARALPEDQRPLILGNGDVSNLTEAAERVEETGADGVMIGRGSFGNPWFFRPMGDTATKSLEERFRVMLEHIYLFEELFYGKKNFDVMKKHYKAYEVGFEGAKELRVRLMEARTAGEVETIVRAAYPNV